MLTPPKTSSPENDNLPDFCLGRLEMNFIFIIAEKK